MLIGKHAAINHVTIQFLLGLHVIGSKLVNVFFLLYVLLIDIFIMTKNMSNI